MSRGGGYGQCKGCGRRIWWATNARNGKPHPFDPEPNLTRGDWLMDYDDVAHQLRSAVARALRGQHEELYLSHFDSCSRRSELRRTMPPGPHSDLGDDDDS